MAFVKEHVRQQREVALDEVADRITLERELVRNRHGRILVPERAQSSMDSDSDGFDMNRVLEMASSVKEAHMPDAREPDVLPEPTASRRNAPPRPFRRCVRVFQPEDMQRLKDIAKSSPSEVRRRMEASIKAAEVHDGYRQIPAFRGIHRVLADLREQFGNFSRVIEHMSGEFVLAGASKPDSFCIRPILLDGPPGVGKTAFAQKVAVDLGLPFRKLSAGGLQAAFALTGSATHWGNSQSGEVFNMIGRGQSATGVLLIDEADKLSDRQDHAILPALLDLLEPESARNFTEESLGLTFDASRLIVLLTSNDKKRMDPALLSRCCAFSIEAPGAEQKALIAKREHAKLNSGLPRSKRMELDNDAVGKLVESDVDVRVLIQAVAKAFTSAMMRGEKVARPILEATNERNRQVGFIWDSKAVH